MKGTDLLACLGKTDDSMEISALLAKLGVTKKPRIKRDDVDAAIDLEKQGLSIVFKQRERKSSALTLTAIQFFSEDEEGFSTFQGTLPDGLSFSDKQPEVRKKLGKPSDTTKELNQDLWNRDGGILLTVEYGGPDGRVSMVAYDIPKKD